MFSTEAIEAVLDMTCAEKTGARGLRSALNKALQIVSWRIDQLELAGASKVEITAETVRNCQEPIISYDPKIETKTKSSLLRAKSFEYVSAT